jgi:hypothetical protein
MKNKIQHDIENYKFFILIDGREAFLQYCRAGENKIDAFKTFVPKELRGLGIAADLAEALIAFAEDAYLEILQSCSFVKKYIDKNRR